MSARADPRGGAISNGRPYRDLKIPEKGRTDGASLCYGLLTTVTLPSAFGCSLGAYEDHYFPAAGVGCWPRWAII